MIQCSMYLIDELLVGWCLQDFCENQKCAKNTWPLSSQPGIVSEILKKPYRMSFYKN